VNQSNYTINNIHSTDDSLTESDDELYDPLTLTTYNNYDTNINNFDQQNSPDNQTITCIASSADNNIITEVESPISQNDGISYSSCLAQTLDLDSPVDYSFSSTGSSGDDDDCNKETAQNDLNLSNINTFDSYLLKQELLKWHFENNTTQAMLSSMLKIWNKFTNFDLPNDARTLLGTQRRVNVKPIEGGNYCHFGLVKALNHIILELKQKINIVQKIDLIINIDGLPLSKSNKSSFWPIMCSDLRLSNKVFIVGVFHGYEKPKSSNEFLEEFISELIPLVKEGLATSEGEVISVNLAALICDAPAKSFVLHIKSHNGYNSCSKCITTGTYIRTNGIRGRVCFPSPNEENEFILRCDMLFGDNYYKDCQNGVSILNNVPNFGLISGTPLDYMHLVCIGVVKKLITLWLEGPLTVRIPLSVVKLISDNLIKIQKCTPNDFARKPRGLTEYKHWKATEYRQFLLYTGPVVLKSILKPDIYNNFIVLHVAISILINPILAKSEQFIKYSHSLLKKFIYQFQNLYGKCFVSHNIHNLMHLANDVKQFGPLDVFSAFKFENNMTFIKKMLKKYDKPLQQVTKWYLERETLYIQDKQEFSVTFRIKHDNGPLSDLFSNLEIQQYLIYSDDRLSFNLSDKLKNCFCLLKNNSVVYIKNIILYTNVFYFIGFKIKTIDFNLYLIPCPSKDMTINCIFES